MSNFSLTNKCRICSSSNLLKVLDLGEQSLSGIFPGEKDYPVPIAPLALIKCSECGLVQLSASVFLGEMYGDNYGYRSGLNSSMVQHLQSKIKKIEELINLKSGDIVIDIGSNDASTLKSYQNQELTLIGVDPTGQKFKDYYPNHIKLIPDFFPSSHLSKLLNNRKAKVITSFSMFYDLEDPVGFAKCIENTLEDNGIWVFEQSYAPSMIIKNSFDTVCHEHLEYYNLKQIHYICEQADLKIIDVVFNDVNGGSISLIASKNSSDFDEYTSLHLLLESEDKNGFNSFDIYNQFKANISEQKEKLSSFLSECRISGKSVYGLGASTKGNTLLQHWNINSDLITAIGEVNNDKYGCFTPGSLIPIISEDEVLANNPDYIVVLPWHFKSFFISMPNLKGQNLVFPLPEFEIISL